MLCHKFEFLLTFENFDIIQYLIEIKKIDAKSIKVDIFN